MQGGNDVFVLHSSDLRACQTSTRTTGRQRPICQDQTQQMDNGSTLIADAESFEKLCMANETLMEVTVDDCALMDASLMVMDRNRRSLYARGYV